MNSQIITIHLLAENTSNRMGLLGEHGLSYLIQTQENTVLFDAGQGLALSHNATVLGVDLHRVNAIVLSHGHYDHTGGLDFLSTESHVSKLYAHPAVYRKKYARRPNQKYASVGMPENIQKKLANLPIETVWTEQPTAILNGLWATGAIPRIHKYEEISGPFFRDEHGCLPDPIDDDQALFFHTSQGLVVLLGCAHSGVVNTLEYIESLTGGAAIHAIIGGMHLLNASPERIQWTMEELQRRNIQRIAPCHCTGDAARHAFHHFFGERYWECSVGTEFQFDWIHESLVSEKSKTILD